MTIDAMAKQAMVNCNEPLIGRTTDFSARNYGWPVLPVPFQYGAVQSKSDAPYLLATLAQLLDEGKISEDAFVKLAEQVIRK